MTIPGSGLVAGATRARVRWNLLAIDREMLAVVPGFVLSRAVLLATALFALRTLPLAPGAGAWQGDSVPSWIAAFSRWDGKWYLSIAQDGYHYQANADSNLNFAPGYPLAMRVVGQALGLTSGEGLLVVGIVLSNLAFLVGLACVYALARRVEDAGIARRTVLWLLVFPTTLCFSAMYPESLFVALAMGSLLLALDGRWALASLAAAGAVLCRNYGVLLAAPLLWEHLSQHRLRLRPSAAWLALVPAAFAAWQGYLWTLTGDPLAMSHAAEQFGRQPIPPWEMLRYYLSLSYWRDYVQSGGVLGDVRSPQGFGVTLLFGLLTLLSWRLRRKSLSLLATVLYVPTISTGAFVDESRYVLELVPAFMVLAQLTSQRRVLVPAVAVSAGLALLVMTQFAVGEGLP